MKADIYKKLGELFEELYDEAALAESADEEVRHAARFEGIELGDGRSLGYSPKPEDLREIIAGRHVIEFDYTDLNGVRTEGRLVEPLSVALHGYDTPGNYTLLAWDRARSAERRFVIPNMRNVFIYGERYRSNG